MHTRTRSILAGLVAAGALQAGQWELGAAAGYSRFRNVAVSSQAGSARGGFAPGALFGVTLGQNRYRLVGGEARYLFVLDDERLSGAQQVQRNGRSHIFDYSVLLHARPKQAAVRPFVAAGAGARWFQGGGPEAAYQPLGGIAVLTRTSEWEPVISFGGGVKFRAGRRALVRVEFRDFTCPLPSSLIAPVPPTGKAAGWLHDFVAMVGIGVTF